MKKILSKIKKVFRLKENQIEKYKKAGVEIREKLQIL